MQTTRGMIDRFLARLAVGNAGLCALAYKGFTEPTRIIPSIGEEPFGLWQAIHEGRRPGVITDLPCCDEEADRASAGVCCCMQLCVQAALGQAPSR